MNRPFVARHLAQLFIFGRNACALLAACCLLHAAESGATRFFDVPAGEALVTLKRAAQQAGLEIMFPAENVRDVRTMAVKGDYAPLEALNRMLAGTSLAAVLDEKTGALAIRPKTARERADDRNEPPPRTDVTMTSSAPLVRMEAMTVTGSHLRRLDSEHSQPVTVVRNDEFDRGAVSTPMELMARVPFAGALSAYENQDGGRVRGAASSVNMRGLGGQNTLILLNGRRMTPYGLTLGGLAFVNINSLPLAAVERVEILRDGASAVYGADATAGVINFITKTKVEATSVAVRYGATLDGHAPEKRGTLVTGKTTRDGKTRITVVADAFSRDALQARDRDFAVRGDLSPFAPSPWSSNAAWNQRSNAGPLGDFTVVALTGQPNRLPGLTGTTAYTDSRGAVQSGNRTPAQYYNDADAFTLVPSRESRDAFITLSHRFNDRLEAFAEFAYNDLKSEVAQSAMTLVSTENRDANDTPLAVPATNYHNPWGNRFYGAGTANPAVVARAVTFRFREENFGKRLGTITSDQARILAGLRGTVFADWSWEAAGAYMENEARDVTRNMVSRSALATSLAKSTPDAFNLFGLPGANAESVLAPLRTVAESGGRAELALFDAKLNGKLADLPAGEWVFASGAEYRREKISSDYSANIVANDVVNTAAQIPYAASRKVTSAFVELGIPLFADNSRTLLSKGELQLAGRVESFSDFGSATKPRFGANVTLLPSLLARASMGRGFRAPTLTQLFGSAGSSMAARVDPFRPQDGNLRRTILQVSTPTLKPENTESFTAGAVWEPKFLQGFSLGVDYWTYTLKDQIAVISRDQQLATELAGGAYSNPNVVRQATTAADPVGTIVRILEPLANLAQAKTDGYDFSMQYVRGERRRGLLTLGVDASYVRDYSVISTKGAPEVHMPTDQSRPRFRSTARLSYSRAGWTGSVSQNYTSHYNPADAVVVGGVPYYVASYATWNASVGYAFGKNQRLHGLEITLGLNNLLDRDPPIYPTRQGYDARLASPQGRFGFVNLAYRF